MLQRCWPHGVESHESLIVVETCGVEGHERPRGVDCMVIEPSDFERVGDKCCVREPEVFKDCVVIETKV